MERKTKRGYIQDTDPHSPPPSENNLSGGEGRERRGNTPSESHPGCCTRNKMSQKRAQHALICSKMTHNWNPSCDGTDSRIWEGERWCMGPRKHRAISTKEGQNLPAA